MSLSEYKNKRDFEKTTEPKDGKKMGKRLSFVVQRHHASHLHYDFRLEVDGVLKSWAVPKGPSLNPKDKRLAMMVEDHPYDYRTFEGIIPKGNYGAGVVNIFDEGTYEPIRGQKNSMKEGLAAGNLKFVLHGRKLKGEFALVRMKDNEQNAWLLIKHNDKYAVNVKYDAEDKVAAKVKQQGKDFKKAKAETEVNTAQKDFHRPMLAKLVKHVTEEKDWIFEEKLDGYRAIAKISKNKISLTSRNGKSLINDYPTLIAAFKKLNIDAVLDGEIVVREKEKTNFQALQQYDGSQNKVPLRYVVFDVLEIKKSDVRMLPLQQRRKLLEKLLFDNKQKEIELITTAKTSGAQFFKQAKEKKWEGIVAKNINSAYVNGARNGSWQKVKIQQTQEAIIVGFTKPSGSRKYFGALVLAIRNEKRQLVYIGNCGTGFSDKSLKEISEILKPLQVKDRPFNEKVAQERNVTWVKPKVVCEVIFSEWTENQHLRHPVFKGIRADKEIADVRLEKPIINDTVAHDELTLKFGRKAVKLTNQTKIYWPQENITKGDLVNYYREIAPFLLPHLKNRPLSLNRHPNGITKPSFFQKDLNVDQIPSWIKYASLKSTHLHKTIDYLICNDEATLLWMVNLGCIEVNPWMSTYRKPNQPLFAVLDLDPNGVDFKEVIKIALTTKEILDGMKLTSFVKTSGSKGIHIVVPLHAYDYEIAKNFIHYLAGLVYEKHPDVTSLERSPSKRKNKIYLDYLQNRKGQTIVAPYSVRPKPLATVSTPLKWEEVNQDLQISDFTIFNIKQRVKKLGDLWKDIGKIKNRLNFDVEKDLGS